MKIVICDSKEALGGHEQWQKIYLTEKLPGCEVAVLYDTGDRTLVEQELKDADVLITAFLPVDEELLSKCERLSCISLTATGYNTIDIEATNRHHVTVMALDDYCTSEVADHTMALMLALLRRLRQYTGHVEQGEWEYLLESPIKRISQLNLGIFGYGRIGRAVAARARAFGMTVFVYQSAEHPVKKQEGIRVASAREIFEQCDVISNHMAQGKDNYHFFDKEAFRTMRRKPFFINTGRGDVVDEKALTEALDEGGLAGAGLDVLASEQPKLSECRLLHRDNVIVTPHAAFYSEESLQAARQTACDNVLHFFRKEWAEISKIVGKR